MPNIIRIPKDRIGVIIGKSGEVKKQIESELKVKLEINSETGEVAIDDEHVDQPLNQLKVVNVVRAIGRGFSPEHAFRLFEDDIYLEIINIEDYTSKGSRKHIQRLKGRLIGAEGKARRLISELTGASITIYGDTVGIIGDYWEVETAKTAVDMLLSGRKHSTVYRFLESRRRELRI